MSIEIDLDELDDEVEELEGTEVRSDSPTEIKSSTDEENKSPVSTVEPKKIVRRKKGRTSSIRNHYPKKRLT